jgi:peptide/nickel transport system substrate-binding protein
MDPAGEGRRGCRRQFTRMMVGAGLTAPLAAQMLAFSGVGGVAQAQPKPAFTPTKRGGGGGSRELWWQAVSI